MKKILLSACCCFLLVVCKAQSVGIGTVSPFQRSALHVVGNNTDSSFAVLVDGNLLGTGLQVVRGGVGIGPFLPSSRLFVATGASTNFIDSFAAIVGYSTNKTAAAYGGVYGFYDQSLYGVGVQGIGYGGVDYANYFVDSIDVGVLGSATLGVTGIGNVIGVYAEAADLLGSAPGVQYGLFATASTGTAFEKYAGFFDGDVVVTGNLSKGSGTFKIDDPIDPANKYLYHSFVESPDMMNVYNGNVTTDANGLAEVTLPAYFNALNKDFRYQLTTIGSFAQAMIKEEISGNHFTIQTSQPAVKVSWQVTGIRQDKFANAHRVKAEVEKEPWNKGLYLHAEEYGLDKSKSIPHMANLKLAPSIGTTPTLQKAKEARADKANMPAAISNLKLAPSSVENK